jgi:hypothetical protein
MANFTAQKGTMLKGLPYNAIWGMFGVRDYAQHGISKIELNRSLPFTVKRASF